MKNCTGFHKLRLQENLQEEVSDLEVLCVILVSKNNSLQNMTVVASSKKNLTDTDLWQCKIMEGYSIK